jgi:hypothetical protein
MGETEKPSEIGPSGQLVCLKLEKSLITAGETIAEGRFC